MTIQTIKYSGLILASIVTLAGCPSDDTGGGGETDDPTTSPSSTTLSTSSPSTSSPSTSATDSMSGTDTETATETNTESDTDTSSSTGPDPTVFMFREDPPDAYTQIDRMGLPAVNTALTLSANKDAYNADDPTARQGGDYDDDREASLVVLHRGDPDIGQTPGNTGLDDDLADLALVPCTTTVAQTCISQVGGLFEAAGDQIFVDTTMPAGFPNGRQPSNAVIDLVLAVTLLQLGPTQPITLFRDLDPPLNPVENDVAFPKGFPYFAPPHE